MHLPSALLEMTAHRQWAALLRATTTNVLTQLQGKCQYHSKPARRQQTHPVTTNLLPLNPLPSNGQLSPQALEATLSKLDESPVQLFLEFILRLGDLPHNSVRAAGIRSHHGTGHRNVLARAHPDIAVFVVVHVDFDGAAQVAGGGREGVGGAPAAVPEVLRGILVRDENDGEVGVRGRGVDADGGCGKVFGGGFGEGLLERADEVGIG